jgi:hypothetical protein
MTGDGRPVFRVRCLTEEIVKKYLEHHRHPSNRKAEDFIME